MDLSLRAAVTCRCLLQRVVRMFRHSNVKSMQTSATQPSRCRLVCRKSRRAGFLVNVRAVSNSSSPGSDSRRQALLGMFCVTFSQLSQPQPAAHSKPNVLDLPACSNFKQAGKIAYCDISIGSGESPLAGDLVEVDYTARAVATGKVYDGSRSFKFTVGNQEAIPGWELAILGDADVPAIKEGGSRTVLIPPELAYGEEGDGCLYGLSSSCRIPPNSPVEITFRYKGLGY